MSDKYRYEVYLNDAASTWFVAENLEEYSHAVHFNAFEHYRLETIENEYLVPMTSVKFIKRVKKVHRNETEM